MKSPFVFGRIASGDTFMDRKTETRSLSDNFCNLTNTILISPRRWGKSSLVRKASESAMARDKNLRICHLDIFNVRTEEEFYEKLAAEVLHASESRWEELAVTAKKYLSAFIPQLNIGDLHNSVSVSLSLRPTRKDADAILDMAERIAADKNISIVVCIDEFQQIASFEDSEAFQSKLRSHWQLHQHVAYCLYGSRRHMMTDIFTNPRKPFYKFGQNIFLEKIDSRYWPPFICTKFEETSKSISYSQAERITNLVDNNPYYIQQLSEMVWNRTSHTCRDEFVDEAFDALVSAQSGLNLALTQMLTLTQQNLLHAIVAGETQLSSAAVLERYGLKNSLTVQRAKKALTQLDIIDDFGKIITMEDPVYAYWLKNTYFGQ